MNYTRGSLYKFDEKRLKPKVPGVFALNPAKNLRVCIKKTHGIMFLEKRKHENQIYYCFLHNNAVVYLQKHYAKMLIAIK